MTTSARVALVVLAAVTLPSFARAQGIGFQGGGTIDPEQFFVGVLFESPAIAETVHVRPGVDGGFGQRRKTTSINIDFLYKSDESSSWRFVTGGGPAIHITRFDDPADGPGGADDSDVSGGLVGLIGVEHTSGFFTEFKFGGTGNGPNLRFGAGFRIGGRQ